MVLDVLDDRGGYKVKVGSCELYSSDSEAVTTGTYVTTGFDHGLTKNITFGAMVNQDSPQADYDEGVTFGASDHRIHPGLTTTNPRIQSTEGRETRKE